MNKEVEIRFDAEAYKEYEELQELVAGKKTAKKKPTYAQLLSSINNAIKNIKADYRYGDLIPRKYISKSTINSASSAQNLSACSPLPGAGHTG